MPRRKSAEEIEGLIFATTMKAVRRSIGAGATAVKEDVRPPLGTRPEEMQEHFNLELSVGEDGSPDWAPAHRRIEEKVEEATAAALRELNLREQLGSLFARRSRTIWAFIFASVLTALGAVILMMLKVTPWDAIAFGVASIFLIIGAIIGAQSVKRARAFYTAILDRHRELLAKKQRARLHRGHQCLLPGFPRPFRAPPQGLPRASRALRASAPRHPVDRIVPRRTRAHPRAGREGPHLAEITETVSAKASSARSQSR